MTFIVILKKIKNKLIIGKKNEKMLLLNDIYNRHLQKRLSKSYKIRQMLYGEGVVRLSNDHDIDLYYRWQDRNRSFGILWLASPSFNLFALDRFKNKKILEIGCSNGWCYRNIYSRLENVEYYGIDIQKETIDEANRKMKGIIDNNSYKFIVADAVTDMPVGDFTNIFWYASMCMFSEQDKKTVLKNISDRLKKYNGFLTGSATINIKDGTHWKYFITAYNSPQELKQELKQFFKNVVVLGTCQADTVFYIATNGDYPILC